jgi:5-methylthioribose kinase
MTVAKILTVETVPSYLKERAAEIGAFDANANLIAKAILGGNVNYAFCVTDENTEKSIFLKQAPEFVAIFGPDGLPLSSARMKQEIAVFDEWKSILGSDASRFLPNIHYVDFSHMVFVMDFLDGYSLLDHVLVDQGMVSVEIARSLGEFMGRTHGSTHSSKIPLDRVDYLFKAFENRPMRDIQLEFVFTKCYKEATDEQRAGLVIDDAFMKEVEDLKSKYDGNHRHNLSLCHGDLHPGSIMIQQDSAKIIDPEFCVYSNPGLDVGSLLSGYCLAAVHQAYSKNFHAVSAIINSAELIWSHYVEEMKSSGISDELIAEIEADAVGFTVAEVCRTAMEFAGGRKWLQFDDIDVKLNAKKTALSIVGNVMTNRHSDGMKLLLSLLKELVEQNTV